MSVTYYKAFRDRYMDKCAPHMCASGSPCSCREFARERAPNFNIWGIVLVGVVIVSMSGAAVVLFQAIKWILGSHGA